MTDLATSQDDEPGELADGGVDDRRDGVHRSTCATARQAAATIRRLESTAVLQHLVDFRRAAEPYAGSAAVRELDAEYRDLLGSVRT